MRIVELQAHEVRQRGYVTRHGRTVTVRSNVRSPVKPRPCKRTSADAVGNGESVDAVPLLSTKPTARLQAMRAGSPWSEGWLQASRLASTTTVGSVMMRSRPESARM